MVKRLQTLVAYTQHCSPGDTTIEAIRQARARLGAKPAEKKIAIVFSDANFRRYGITPDALQEALTGGDAEAEAFLILIGSFDGEASAAAERLRGRVVVCNTVAEVPQKLKGLVQALFER